MHRSATLAALAAALPSALAAFQGFNYGSTFTTGAAKQQADFEAEFKNAQGLIGAPGVFNSARLYTSIQAGTANSPIAAIPAAISTKTSLLLGLWASAGDAVITNEIQAIQQAIATYGTAFTSLVAGISVGSEDLYRISPTGIINKENPGADPLTIAGYIKQLKSAIAGTPLANAPVGHVDTWTAWVNGSNQAVIDAVDWLGVDAYPYFQNTQANGIENGKGLFFDALGATNAAAGGKPVWVTETGFPVSGKSSGQAVPSLENAKTYWDQVGCSLFGSTNTWWFTMQDASPDLPNPSFGLIGSTLTTTPLFDLSCAAVAPPPASSSSAAPPPPASSTSSSSSSANGGGSPPPASSSSTAAPTTTSAPASSSTSSSISVPATLGGGSPGGVPSSQLSLETGTLTSTISKPTGSPVSGPTGGAGSNSSVSSSTSKPTPTPSTTNNNGAGALSASLVGAVAAVMFAVLAM